MRFAAFAVDGFVADVGVMPVLFLALGGHAAGGHAVEVAETGVHVRACEELGGAAFYELGRPGQGGRFIFGHSSSVGKCMDCLDEHVRWNGSGLVEYGRRNRFKDLCSTLGSPDALESITRTVQEVSAFQI